MKSTLTNGVGCEGWMSELPDNVLLSKLSIPGTHNSMSYTCYEANIILKIISGLSKLGKDRLAELDLDGAVTVGRPFLRSPVKS